MNEETVKEFEGKLNTLLAEYGIENAAFTGSHGDVYIGLICRDATIEDLWKVSLNAGRLWQHVRGQVREILNRYEADIWSVRGRKALPKTE